MRLISVAVVRFTKKKKKEKRLPVCFLALVQDARLHVPYLSCRFKRLIVSRVLNLSFHGLCFELCNCFSLDFAAEHEDMASRKWRELRRVILIKSAAGGCRHHTLPYLSATGAKLRKGAGGSRLQPRRLGNPNSSFIAHYSHYD